VEFCTKLCKPKTKIFLKMRFNTSRKNITRSCDVCSLPYRGTNGRVCFQSRAGSRHQWAGPAYTAAARCVRVFPALSAHNLSHLHKSSVQDQDASNICAAALRSLRSVRHSACYGVLLFEGTPSALPVRFRAHRAESSHTASVGRIKHILDK
jgi:hypothetical protein